ncbi:MAG: hypothetical protein JSW03_05705 [Candidatus Eiseniibacteriota bacterium]|nr:MAG: hypothetical protein JSW03_05705 [Candidatus Eisenbacteria bacterium]
MRESTARCSVMLLAIFLVALFFASADLASPPCVDCRETVRFSEDSGDPDMPDCAGPGSEAADGTPSGSAGENESSEELFRLHHDVQLEKAKWSGRASFDVERAMAILRLCASVSSLAIAF